MLAAGVAVGAATDLASPYGYLAAWLAVAGLGIVMALAPAVDAVLDALPPKQAGSGTAITMTLRQTGGAPGVALLGSLLAEATPAGSTRQDCRPKPAAAARESIAGAHAATAQMGEPALAASANAAYLHGMSLVLIATAITAGSSAILELFVEPGRSRMNGADGPTPGRPSPTFGYKQPMNLRNGQHGYGAVTKALHWLTVAAFAAQFYVGYSMETEDDLRERECDPPGEDRRRGETSEAEEDRLDRLEERCERGEERREEAAEDPVGTAWSELTGGDGLGGGLSMPELHVLLGLLILLLAALRLMWRKGTPLPPWDPRLTPGNRRTVHATETVLITLQFVVPITGILLVAGDDDWLWLHIAGHFAFFTALAAHLGMVLAKGLLPRMLPGNRGSTAQAPAPGQSSKAKT